MKKAYEKKKIDFKKYINEETGETLSSEIRGAISINVRNEDKLFMDDKSYFTINSESLDYIKQEFNHADMGRILIMCGMVRGEYNILYDYSDKKARKPYVRETLMRDLDLTVNRFRDFINRLYDKHILCTIIEHKDDAKEIWFMMSPYLVRKQKGFNPKCANQFQKLSPKQDI